MRRKRLIANTMHEQVVALTRFHKKLLMVIADLIMIPIALWTAYALRISDWWPERYLESNFLLFFILPPLGVFIFARLGLYRAIVRFVNMQAIWAVAKGVILLASLIYVLAMLFSIHPFSRSVPIIFSLVALIYVGGSRLIVRSYYHWLVGMYTENQAVIIYGAGYAGAQMASSIQGDPGYEVVGFIDDDPALQGSVVAGGHVYSSDQLSGLITKHHIEYVLLAMPSAVKAQKKAILDKLSAFQVHVKTVPSNRDIMSGELDVEQLRDIELDDLLGRDAVPPIGDLIARSLSNKVVLVTGAGGSIGSEICRKVALSKPELLILFDQSEFNLYQIEKELAGLQEVSEGKVRVLPLLGSVRDEDKLLAVLKKFKVQTLYHAAAYKHVPLVEHNVIEGVRNNVIGTAVAARASLVAGVERFVLVSTDKAVRPTNVMGATKRIAELILQAYASKGASTIFSMVRFGNVLGSSGSVVPLFKEQIESGGPVTVTDPDVIRYFMTIPEAASLVIQAGSMARGGEVFVLDMGEPVRIKDLAEKMIQLMGYKLKSGEDPSGIAIEYTGLRPGEKLYEELLLSEHAVETEHPSIAKAQEEKLPLEDLELLLSELESACVNNNGKKLRSLLQQNVSGYRPDVKEVDLLLDS